MKKKISKKTTYEEAIARLEAIVSCLEDPEIPLEESLEAFQEGIELSRFCREKLAEIEYRVDYLLKEEQKKLLKEQGEDIEGLAATGGEIDNEDDDREEQW